MRTGDEMMTNTGRQDDAIAHRYSYTSPLRLYALLEYIDATFIDAIFEQILTE